MLPAIDWYTGYFSPEVRGLDRLPGTGPVLVVGNHSCLFYMPEVWVSARAIMQRRGVEAPLYALGYDLLFAIPGVESVIRRLGAVPAGPTEAESALRHGACVAVYPGGDWEAARPWAQRNQVDFGGRKGFVRLALRCGIPVVPDVTHGGHHAVVVVTRGDRLARALGLDGIRIKVFPFLAGVPFGLASVLTPPLPMPAQVTVEFLPALDWSGYGPSAERDDKVVTACYDEITGILQAALDRLSAERPHPVVDGTTRLITRTVSTAGRAPASLAQSGDLVLRRLRQAIPQPAHQAENACEERLRLEPQIPGAGASPRGSKSSSRSWPVPAQMCP